MGTVDVRRLEEPRLGLVEQRGTGFAADQIADLGAHDPRDGDPEEQPAQRQVRLAAVRVCRGVRAGEEEQRITREEEPDEQAGLGEHDQNDTDQAERRHEAGRIEPVDREVHRLSLRSRPVADVATRQVHRKPAHAGAPARASRCTASPRRRRASESYRRAVADRLVVIGGDAGGMSAASQARRRRSPDDLQIVAFERGSYTSYSACGIPYWIGSVVGPRDRLIARPPEVFRDRFGIDVRIRHDVEEIDLAARRVVVRAADDGAPEYRARSTRWSWPPARCRPAHPSPASTPTASTGFRHSGTARRCAPSSTPDGSAASSSSAAATSAWRSPRRRTGGGSRRRSWTGRPPRWACSTPTWAPSSPTRSGTWASNWFSPSPPPPSRQALTAGSAACTPHRAANCPPTWSYSAWAPGPTSRWRRPRASRWAAAAASPWTSACGPAWKASGRPGTASRASTGSPRPGWSSRSARTRTSRGGWPASTSAAVTPPSRA